MTHYDDVTLLGNHLAIGQNYLFLEFMYFRYISNVNIPASKGALVSKSAEMICVSKVYLCTVHDLMDQFCLTSV